ncbi:hypothetical protein V3C99_012711 [Haemonchus contortus]|uniref:Serpentine receptor class gamma n=1 Tax=Haemonchus contortus TaxID=6289 RepID=A0A7I4Y1M1_HAECO
MNCSDAAELARDVRFRTVLGIQASAGLVSLVVSSIVLRKCGSLYFHVNCKIMITAMLVLFIIHSIFISGLQGMHLVRYVSISDPCQISVRSAICFSMRYPTTACTTCMVLLELSMIIERAIALWKRSHYDSFGPRIGLTLTALSVLFGVLSCAWAMGEEDFSQHHAYCSAMTAKTSKNMGILLFVSSGISVITLCSIVVLFISNSFVKKRTRFHLNTSYQLRENKSVLRLLLPLDVLQATISGLGTMSTFIIMTFKDQLASTTYRTLLASTYLFPYYTVASPTLIWFVIRWSRRLETDRMDAMMKKRSETDNDIYFRTYGEMWGYPR